MHACMHVADMSIMRYNREGDTAKENIYVSICMSICVHPHARQMVTSLALILFFSVLEYLLL
jgi:hypothetical protein